ncbi:MAG TPA: ATP synthase subunit C, partial [Gallionellaceae bacterium]|nr:ATP synthase subunit C [Gallionellaceae bacterium]
AAFMTLNIIALVALGVYFELKPYSEKRPAPRWFKAGLGGNLVLFVVAEAALVLLGLHDAMAQAAISQTVPAVSSAHDASLGFGLAMIGIGLPTGLATIAAGIAVGPVGAASLAVIAEKPEVFGRTLIYLGLAEGIAIYGLVVTILMLGKI